MHRLVEKVISLLVTALVLAASTFARASEPATFTYAPSPPGSIVDSRIVYLTGEGTQSQWRAVISKKTVGTGERGERFYQYYLSIYRIDGSTYRLKFQSPRDGGPFTAVERAHGAKLWFPVQSARIAGTGEFLAPTVQQVVVQSHEMAADCGLSTITVFAYDRNRRKVVPSATVSNYCNLEASVVSPSDGSAISLRGPYYKADAALCCPTRPKAAATLRYAGGTWIETPNYFPLKK
ncbi:MAG: hypothetical protein ACREMT_03040 [Vulcanimicrobiaceae bacterium]